MKLIDVTHNASYDESGNRSLKGLKALKVSPDTLSYFYTYRDQGFALTNSRLVGEIADRWTDAVKGGANIEISEVFVDASKILCVDQQSKRVFPVDKENLGQMEVADIAVSRCIAKISAKGFDQSFAPAIAVNINEKGYEFGWGNQVFICSNFNILNTAHRWNDYQRFKKSAGGGSIKLELKQMREILQKYMADTAAFFEQQLREIQLLQSVTISKTDFSAFMGKMFTKIEYANAARVERRIANLSEKEKFLPVNSRQLAAIAVESVSPKHPEVFGWQNDCADLWQVANWGSETLKAQHGCDMATLLQTNANWVGVLKQEFLN